MKKQIKKVFLSPYIHAVVSWIFILTLLNRVIGFLFRAPRREISMDFLNFENILIGLVVTALIFSVHAYFRSGRYLKERNKIMDNIITLAPRVAKNEDTLKKVITEIAPDTLEFSEEFKEMAKRRLNINL